MRFWTRQHEAVWDELQKTGQYIVKKEYIEAKNDTISKIVPYFQPGNITTVARYDVDYIVTEYGIAPLRYKTVRQRAENLIAIADPKFRDELLAKAKEMGLIPLKG